ncbi:MAG: hypothetical protein H7329_09915 [Opitutaceae bacterium]|nr:hypothetical protein [Cytophagales bacterium]
MKNTFYFLISFLLFTACNKSSEQKETTDKPGVENNDSVQTQKSVNVTPRLKSPRFDSLALLISGKFGNGYSSIRETAYWKAYASSMDSTLKIVTEKRLGLMREWAKNEYDKKAQKSDTLFYPFSGPDFLNAYTLFPNTKTYFLIALEPIGLLPEIEPNQSVKTEKFFSNLKISLDDIYKKSYFITKRMNVHLGGAVYGTLPLMTVFLKQTDHTISDIKSIKLDSTGKFIEGSYSELAKSAKRPRGVKIEFYKNGEKTLRQLYYFSADLGDGALTDKFRFRKFLDKMGHFNAYAKSASYLMHYEEFAVIRNHILNKANLLLQDDTGIAFHYVKKEDWNICLYGTYVPPVKDFSKYLYQKSLTEAYKKDSANVKELPFELGYHWGSKKNNLMLFVRK